MGGSSSKVARTASGAATRKYPSRIPPTSAPRTTNVPDGPRPAPESSVGPSVHPQTRATEDKSEAITRDASDPDLALNERMRQLGPVQPNPTYSNSSTFNSRHSSSPSSTSSSTSSQPSPSTFPQSSAAGQNFIPSSSTPQQSLFPNAAANPAIGLLEARQRLAEEADEEFENVARLGKGARGRKFLDVWGVRQVVRMREEGIGEEEIEDRLGLRTGTVGRLGRLGLVGGGAGDVAR